MSRRSTSSTKRPTSRKSTMMTSPSREPLHRLRQAAWALHDATARAIHGPLDAASWAGIDVHPEHPELRELRDAIAGVEDAFENIDAAWRGM
jgi:hypothetical protein